jgi:hypothetical protein
LGTLAGVEITVWFDSVDMECCGEPFRIGSRVAWELRRNVDARWLTDVLGPGIPVPVDAYVVRHSDEDDVIEPTHGTVVHIRGMYWQVSGSSAYPVPASGALTEVAEAEQVTPDEGDLQFAGFLVGLREDPTP